MGIDGDYSFYLGKKVAYVYRGQKEIRGSKIRVIWGKVTRPHGMSLVGPLGAKWLELTAAHRQLGRRARQVHKPPSLQIFRRVGSHHALSFFDLSEGARLALVGKDGS